MKCVRVTAVEDLTDPEFCADVSASMGIQCFQLEFEADYLEPFESGSGQLSVYYKVHADPHMDPSDPDYGRIVEIGTGP